MPLVATCECWPVLQSECYCSVVCIEIVVLHGNSLVLIVSALYGCKLMALVAQCTPS